jgi:hypothetical protein
MGPNPKGISGLDAFHRTCRDFDEEFKGKGRFSLDFRERHISQISYHKSISRSGIDKVIGQFPMDTGEFGVLSQDPLHIFSIL